MQTNLIKRKLLAIIVFGIAFAFVESAVVYYLRAISDFSLSFTSSGNFKQSLNLGFIVFLAPGSIVLPNLQITHAESLREIATIIMLGAVSFLAGTNLKQRFGAFLISFATWDIFYYIFLRYLTGWPQTLSNIDVYFINPVPWVGPVLTPVIVSSAMFILGVKIYLESNKA